MMPWKLFEAPNGGLKPHGNPASQLGRFEHFGQYRGVIGCVSGTASDVGGCCCPVDRFPLFAATVPLCSWRATMIVPVARALESLFDGASDTRDRRALHLFPLLKSASRSAKLSLL